MSIHDAGWRVATSSLCLCAAPGSATWDYASEVAGSCLPHMRIAIDIDSTLHHYWDVLSRAARDRFGVDLPYDLQVTWGITRLKPRQVQACVDDTHRDAAILAATPYPGAVETVRAWREAGHFIHITSHRAVAAEIATAAWLDRIGLPYDELYCSQDKVSHAIEIGIDVLIDDKPADLMRAADAGITVATLLHPWNAELCAEEDIVCAPDWPALRRQLEPLLGGAA
jgi:uncharacterized protein